MEGFKRKNLAGGRVCCSLNWAQKESGRKKLQSRVFWLSSFLATWRREEAPGGMQSALFARGLMILQTLMLKTRRKNKFEAIR